MIKIPKLRGFDFEKLSYQDFIETLNGIGDELIDLGVSSNGEDNVYGIRIGGLDGSKPIIIIEGGIHGAHEWRCGYWIREFIKMIDKPSLYTQKRLLTSLKIKFDFFFIPCLNPYGYINNTYQNANGVNLNRNFPVGWDEWQDVNPWHSQYKGTAPFSEIESQMVRNLVETHKPVLFIDCHTWGGFDNATIEIEYNASKYHILAKETCKSLEMNTGNDITYYRYPKLEPRVGAWVSTVNSILRLPITTYTYESGENESNTKQAELGLNGLLLSCIHLSDWYESRILR